MKRCVNILLSLYALSLLGACRLVVVASTGNEDPQTPWDWSEDYVLEQVGHVRAGRDLNPESWCGGARVSVLLSFDVDNETVMGLRTGEISVGPLSQGQYVHRVALARIVELMDEENIPATFFFPA